MDLKIKCTHYVGETDVEIPTHVEIRRLGTKKRLIETWSSLSKSILGAYPKKFRCLTFEFDAVWLCEEKEIKELSETLLMVYPNGDLILKVIGSEDSFFYSEIFNLSDIGN